MQALTCGHVVDTSLGRRAISHDEAPPEELISAAGMTRATYAGLFDSVAPLKTPGGFLHRAFVVEAHSRARKEGRVFCSRPVRKHYIDMVCTACTMLQIRSKQRPCRALLPLMRRAPPGPSLRARTEHVDQELRGHVSTVVAPPSKKLDRAVGCRQKCEGAFHSQATLLRTESDRDAGTHLWAGGRHFADARGCCWR